MEANKFLNDQKKIEDDLLHAMDILDLDECIVDEKVDRIISKSTISDSDLRAILVFTKYKYMISSQEETDCDNETLVNYVLKQLVELDDGESERFALLLKVLIYSVQLDGEKMILFIEHIIQQLFSSINTTDDNQVVSKDVMYLKIIDSMISLCIKRGFKPDYKFLNSEVFTLLQCKDERLYKEIISTIVPNVIVCYEDHDILNVIWDRIVDNIDGIRFRDILTLCTLSDFYFPIKKIHNGYKIESFIINDKDFWRLIQRGICNEDLSMRKYSNYLAKRAIDHICQNHSIVCVVLDDDNIPLVSYDSTHRDKFEDVWTNFFIIIESLEEKQLYLVDAALNLLPKISSLHPSWFNCILRRALMHDTETVLSKVLRITFEYNPPARYMDSFPYDRLMNVLNKTFVYDNLLNAKENHVMMLFSDFVRRGSNFSRFIETLKSYPLSPIPRFFISYLFMTMENCSVGDKLQDYIDSFITDDVYNNALIEYGTRCCIVNYCTSTLSPTLHDLLIIFTKTSDMALVRHNQQWNDIVLKLKNLNETQIREDILIMTLILLKCDKYHLKPIIKLLIAYFESSESRIVLFNRIITDSINRLKGCNTRTYALCDEFDMDFFIIVDIYESIDIEVPDFDDLNINFINRMEDDTSISSFLLFRLQNISSLSDYRLVDKCIDGVRKFSPLLNLQSVTNACIDMLKNVDTSAIQKYFAIKIIYLRVTRYDYNITTDKSYVEVLNNMHFLKLSDDDKNLDDSGRLISSYNHTICQIQYYYYMRIKEWTSDVTSTLYDYILNVLEKGGTECLLWPIKLSKILLKKLIEENIWDKVDFLLNRIWKEVLQVRKNHQFRECIDEFIILVYDEGLLAAPDMRALSLVYADRLFDLGEATPIVVCMLIREITQLRNATSFVPIIVKSLMFCTVPRRDQRIEQGICDFIESNEKLFTKRHIEFFVSNPYEDIKVNVVESILKYRKNDFHTDMIKHLQDRIESMCKEKHRYHANSSNHRSLLRALQMLLLIYKVDPNLSDARKTIDWGKRMLMRQPHHASVRMILEWYISLHLIYTDKPLKESVDEFGLSQLNQVSFFMIIYHVVKHQLIACRDKMHDNFYYVMDKYLPFTMGQLFNVRLYSQYLFTRLYRLMNDIESKCKYDMMHATIEANFELSSDEKSLKKIQTDFYVNRFDIVCNLNVCDIYHNVPRLTDVSEDEWIKHKNILYLDELLHDYENPTTVYSHANKYPEFDLCCSRETLKTSQSIDVVSNQEDSGVIQKKFVPWKSMLVDMGLEKKTENTGNEMVVVASLIDRIPNLGGLSRTCEVFGVKQYIISSLRHLQDKQFQSLSVSSEKWIDIAEIRPGQELKNYLTAMKAKGYKIVGAEQTSSSVLLNQFKFPKKMVLLLGNEKEGVPPDLLHMMDYCVEIPQHGVIRSLNVHVTASIFIWEYARQHES